MDITDEKLLIELAKQGNEPAFSELIDRYQQKVYNTAFRMTGNYHDACDCVQEVFLRVFRSLASFRGESSFSTWLYHITVNVCRDMLRGQSRHRYESIDEMLCTEKGELKKELPDTAPQPEEICENSEFTERIYMLLDQLEPNYRMVLMMREHDELSYQEIADILHLSIGTVKSRIARARLALKKKICEDGKLFAEAERLYDTKQKRTEVDIDGMP